MSTLEQHYLHEDNKKKKQSIDHDEMDSTSNENSIDLPIYVSAFQKIRNKVDPKFKNHNLFLRKIFFSAIEGRNEDNDQCVVKTVQTKIRMTFMVNKWLLNLKIS